MNFENWILTDDLCTYYRVEQKFIEDLHESELIHLRVYERRYYLSMDEIGEFERMCRLHYEMEVNLEGLEVIRNLLDSVRQLQDQNRRLQNRLGRYE